METGTSTDRTTLKYRLAISWRQVMQHFLFTKWEEVYDIVSILPHYLLFLPIHPIHPSLLSLSYLSTHQSVYQPYLPNICSDHLHLWLSFNWSKHINSSIMEWTWSGSISSVGHIPISQVCWVSTLYCIYLFRHVVNTFNYKGNFWWSSCKYMREHNPPRVMANFTRPKDWREDRFYDEVWILGNQQSHITNRMIATNSVRLFVWYRCEQRC